jgi:hypothetical protein
MSNKMRYEKACDQFASYENADWGKFCIYLEIADDLYVSRQVRVYENGNCLRYDREHWEDEFGSLGSARHTAQYDAACGEKWTIEKIAPEEFEAVWESANSAPNQPQRYDDSITAWTRHIEKKKLTSEQQKRLPPWIAKLYNANERTAPSDE